MRAERQAKVERATPPQRESIEKGLRTFEKAFGRFNRVKRGKGGFHFAGGDFPAGSGFGFGLGYTRRGLLVEGYPDPDRPNRVDVDVVAAYSTREYYELSSEIKYLNIGGSIVNMAFRGRYLEYPEEEFFGLGSESAREDRSIRECCRQPRHRHPHGWDGQDQGTPRPATLPQREPIEKGLRFF